jgi:hypothetical protein
MNTCDPSDRMKSGLFGSRPSAKNATFTPLPVARFCACGVLASMNAVFVVCSVSGSSSGLAGSVGQVWVPDAGAGGIDGGDVPPKPWT